MNDLYLENRRLRGQLCILNRTFEDLCDTLECEYDNEAALMKIIDLKARAEKASKKNKRQPWRSMR